MKLFDLVVHSSQNAHSHTALSQKTLVLPIKKKFKKLRALEIIYAKMNIF